jgi:hypothetical protein
MKFLDDIDIKMLKENFDENLIKKANLENVSKILHYLNNNGIYYAKDLFITFFNLFLLPYETFVEKFEHLKTVVGNEYIDKIGEDMSLMEIMYE